MRQARLDLAAYMAQIGVELYSAAADLIDQPDMPPEASAAEQKLQAAANHSESDS